MRRLLSFRQYAAHRGCSVQAVSKAVKAGRITTVLDEKGRRRIDPEVADIQWARNTDADQARRAAGNRVPAPPANVGAPDHPAGVSARERNEAAQADLRELELQEKRGMLVKAEDVKRRAFVLARSLRDSLLATPARLAAMAAAESDPAKVHAMLDAEMRKIAGEIADMAAGDPTLH